MFPLNFLGAEQLSLYDNTLEGSSQRVALDKIPQLKVGEKPEVIVSNIVKSKQMLFIYVANTDPNSISVIDGRNNTVVKDIPLDGRPGLIKVDDNDDMIYVANTDNYSISVFDSSNYTNIRTIELDYIPKFITINEENGKIYIIQRFDCEILVIDENYNKTIQADYAEPEDIEVNEDTNTIYILKSDYENPLLNGYVTILNSTNDEIIKEIEVSAEPSDIEVNEDTNTIYVSNPNSDSISIIEGKTNNLIAGVKFRITPENSGEILCNGLTPSLNRYIQIFSNYECTARPGKGFEFNSWSQNMEDNSSRIIQLASDSNPVKNSILDFFGSKNIPPESKLRITQFETYTANFRELSPITS